MTQRKLPAIAFTLACAVLVFSGSRPAYAGGWLTINEVNSNQPGAEISEYIELKYENVANSEARTVLSGYVVVLYDGRSGTSYLTISLDGRTVASDGFFLIGMPGVQPQPDIIITGSFLQNGDQLDNPDAVALYNGTVAEFPNGTPVHSRRLVDAVVYNKFSRRGNLLLANTLSPSIGIVHETEGIVDGVRTDLAISWCPNSSDVLVLSQPTPGRRNNCTAYEQPQADVSCPSFPSQLDSDSVPTVIESRSGVTINEVSADSPVADTEEFIELFDGGGGNTSLAGITLVFFDGSLPGNSAYGAIDLSPYSTNFEGYFVIGSQQVFPPPDLEICEHFIGNGPDAVALYSSVLSNTSQVWSNASLPTQSGLLDAVVYSRGRAVDDDLLGSLVPGQRQLQERDSARRNDDVEVSLSRCKSVLRLRQDGFIVGTITPGSENNCTALQQGPALFGTLLISEVFPQSSSGFVELSDRGVGFTTLFGVTIDFTSGDTRFQVDLSGYNTDRNGLFVIGTYAGAHVLIDPELLSEKSGTISLKQDGAALDRVEYSTVQGVSNGRLYTPSGYSLSRCFSQQENSPGAFVSGKITPAKANLCRNIIINEVNAIPSVYSLASAKFVELYSGGDSAVPLAQYTLVIDDGRGNNIVYYSLANFSTSSSGFFTLADQPVFGSSGIVADDRFLSGPSGVVRLQRGPGNVTVSTFHIANTSNGREVNSTVDLSASICAENSTHAVALRRRPTAGLPNDCGQKVAYPESSTVIISELDANQPGVDSSEYIELQGAPNTSLDDLQLVVFQSIRSPVIVSAYTLVGYETDSNGYFLLGAEECLCNADINLTSNLPNTLSGVALYQLPPSWITLAPQVPFPPSQYLLDAVIYNANRRFRADKPQRLLDLLLPCQDIVQERGRASLSRCRSSQPLYAMAFLNTRATPGSANSCAGITLSTTFVNTSCAATQPPQTTILRSTTERMTAAVSSGTVTRSAATLATATASQTGGISKRSVLAIVIVCIVGAMITVALVIFCRYRRRSMPRRQGNVFSRINRQISVHPFDVAPLPPLGDDSLAFMKLEEPLSGTDDEKLTATTTFQET